MRLLYSAAILTCALLGVLAPGARADFDLQYCYNGHSAYYWCTGGHGEHSWDYNRMYSNETMPCQRLRTNSGNWRAGDSCADPGVYSVSHNYSGGWPASVAGCTSNSTSAFFNCLASTP